MRGLLVSLALGLAVWAHSSPAQARPAPSLVVVVIVDQFAAHQLERWEPLMTGGIRDLLRTGAVHTQARYAYANTETAAGHATAMTGAWPSVHGIIANHWYDEATGRERYCYEDDEHGRSPGYLAAPTFADALRLASGGRSKSIALSLKDRAAIPLGGTRPDLAAWYDKRRGTFVAGAWPGASTPKWFAGAVAGLGADAARGTTWTRARPDLDYAAHAGPDDHPAEEDVPILGRTFPHRIPEDAPPEALRRVYRTTPKAMEALFGLARRAIDEEQLGARGVTDLLGLGISTTDYTGHAWGGYSHEHLDAVLRLDAQLGELLTHLYRTRGRDRVLVVLTADHGSVIAPEKADLLGVATRRISKKALLQAAQADLRGEARVLDVNAPFVYLSPTPAKVDRVALRRRVARALTEVPGIEEAWSLDDVHRFAEPYGPLFDRSLYLGRRPDVLLRVRPGHYVSAVDAEGHGQGTGHGSPYVYDMAVPLLISGPGLRAGVVRRPVDMTRLAPTLAALVGIPPPAAALDAPLDAAAP